MPKSVIVIDDEQDFLESVRRGLITSGYRNVSIERDARAAADQIRGGKVFDIALIDITMPGVTGVELLDLIKAESPLTECIMVTAIDEARVAVDCLKKGAYDYLVKPISKEELLQSIARALERKRLYEIIELSKSRQTPEVDEKEAFAPIVTRSPAMLRLLREAELHAQSEVPILISGETGTGKELLARAIHDASHRKGKRFTPINVDAVDTTLFAAEFFGHTKGAFTGASAERAGFVESTHKGTLFLDEIGNLPLELQGKLLRVLQSGEYIKLGTTQIEKADLRIIAATNEDLERMVTRRKFRKDLYYRLRGAWLQIPPLRERAEDIPLLVRHFFERFSPGGEDCLIEDEAMAILSTCAFPGNVRELMSIVQSTLNLSQGQGLLARHLPAKIRRDGLYRNGSGRGVSGRILPMAEVEKAHILDAYRRSEGNKTRTAELLGMSLSTLRRKLEGYGEA